MQKLEKILEELNRRINEYVDHDYVRGSGDVVKGLSIAKSIIRKHMSGKDTDVPTNDGWIPVEERMPEEKKSVLVQWEKYDRHLNVTLTYLDVMWLDDAEEQVFETTNGVPNGKVIAWRPLPEPYRPERSVRE